MSRIRKNIEYYRLPHEVEGTMTDNETEALYNANHITEGYETRTYSSASYDTAGTMIIRQYIDGTKVRQATYTYSGGDLDTIVTLYYDTDGTTVLKTTTETFSYDGNGFVSQIDVVTT